MERGTRALPDSGLPRLGYGNGRSYGDVCLNDGGTLLDCRPLSSILAFDRTTGLVEVEAGVLLADLLRVIVPEGWFLPVTPGTKFVTVGGAIANDVHGKNHHRAGTFGRHVPDFDLLRSDRGLVRCSADTEPELYSATIGGLGLTGLITRATLQLRPIQGRAIDTENVRFGGLDDFFEISAESDETHEYTVAWIDCSAGRATRGRGWFYRGNHASGPNTEARRPGRVFRWPVTPPISLVNRVSVRLFNELYFHRPVPAEATVDYEPFFYPLDGILEWNRMYGRRGFYQFQCVVPPEVGSSALAELLAVIAKRGQGSFLAVLKQFGDLTSPGLLSFPRPGPTLALDVPNRGASTLALLRDLESIVREAGGAIYPAKDATMEPRTFEASFPGWTKLAALQDPTFSSSFWRRVTGASQLPPRPAQ